MSIALARDRSRAARGDPIDTGLCQSRHNPSMSSDDRQTSPPPALRIAPADSAAAPDSASDVLAVAHTDPPVLAGPEMLVEGFRYLQQRIPEFTHLSWQEKRSHARAANLDPEFIESGLQAAEVWHHTKIMVQRTAEELRQEQDESRRWDQVIVELRAIIDGIEAANLKRKHRLGTAILQLYRMIGICLRNRRPDDVYLRPYYENMKRAYLRTQQFRKRKKKEEPASS